MRRSTPSVLLLGALAAFVFVVSGCVEDVSQAQERRTQLTASVAEFDAASLGTVTCDIQGGEIGLNRGLTELVVLADASNWKAVETQFESNGYSADAASNIMQANRPGLLVSIRLITAPGAEPAIEKDLTDLGCSIPHEGAIAIKFEERGLPPGV